MLFVSFLTAPAGGTDELDWNLLFFLNSALLGVGLAMDAFSVSCANGLNEPNLKPGRAAAIAGIYGGFQFAMPLIGWAFVHTIATYLKSSQRIIHIIAFALLLYIGIKMIITGIAGGGSGDAEEAKAGLGALLIEGVVTSIDALSVGFTISEYGFAAALLEAGIIGIVTFAICVAGLYIGRAIGTRFAGKASVIGGVILVAIGIENLVMGIIK